MKYKIGSRLTDAGYEDTVRVIPENKKQEKLLSQLSEHFDEFFIGRCEKDPTLDCLEVTVPVLFHTLHTLTNK